MAVLSEVVTEVTVFPITFLTRNRFFYSTKVIGNALSAVTFYSKHKAGAILCQMSAVTFNECRHLCRKCGITKNGRDISVPVLALTEGPVASPSPRVRSGGAKHA